MTHLEIEAFFEILKAGSISCAAQNLYVTQPALSRRIKVLEAELGYPLFERNRGKRNIVLTKQGSIHCCRPQMAWRMAGSPGNQTA